MSEHVCYMKARFPTPAHLKRVFPEMQRLWKQGVEAHDYWQKNRDKKPDEFWPGFTERFPLVAEYLDTIPARSRRNRGKYRIKGIKRDGQLDGKVTPLSILGGNCDNDLAGLLDFGCEDDHERLEIDGSDKAVLLFNAEIWSMSEWNVLMNFLRKKWGAVETGWINETEVDAYDSIQV